MECVCVRKVVGVHVCGVIWCLGDICVDCDVEETVYVCLLKIAWCEQNAFNRLTVTFF